MALKPMISTIGPYALNMEITALTDAAYPSANLIIYVPIRVPEACTVKRVFWINTGTVNGNVNVGLYSQAGVKQWETGSTAQSGTHQAQLVNIADQALAAGLHYLAFQQSGTTGKFSKLGSSAYALASAGVMMEAAGSFALPDTATFATMTQAYVPAFGLDLRG